MQELKSKWSDMWENSPRKQKIAQYGDEFPFNTLLIRLSSLTRSQSSLVMQLRCGHFSLNLYLHKINKSDSNRCTACHKDRDQESRPFLETINHYLFVCTAHTAARHEMTRKIGRDNLNLLGILSNANRIKALTTYINRTGRLKN
jgi:hypothetical protein